MFVDAMHEAAVKTLEAAGYTYHGGELWKPPLGPSAKPFLDRIAELEATVEATRALVAEAAMTGFQPLTGKWAERLFHNQQALTRVLRTAANARKGAE